MLEREFLATLQNALETLPSRQRKAFSLWQQGYSYRQIAQALGCSPSAVESLLHRARQTLKKRLNDIR